MDTREIADGRVGGSSPIATRAKLTWPLALLLFAPASVFAYMSGNLDQTSLRDAVPALAGSAAFAVAVWCLVVALRRRADAAAAVIACLWVVASLFYFNLFGALNRAIGGSYTHAATLPIALAALLAMTAAVHRFRAVAAPVHIVLTAIAVVLLATPLWQAGAYAWRNGAARAVYDPARAVEELAPFLGPAVATEPSAARPPDIYHLVFDRYASEDILARHFGIEPRIGAFLAERGFHVATDSNSNYLKTGHSLASTFYMDYLDLLSDPRVAGTNWHPIFAMLDDHRVGRILREQGYSILQFGSWWTGTHHSAVADENHPGGFSEFTMYYLRRTALRPLVNVLPDNRLQRLLDWDSGQCQRVAAQVEQIKSIGVRDEPVYVFAHFLVPHDPFVFAPDGRCLTLDESNARGSSRGYVDQIAYANRLIEDIVTALQADDRPPPVILIQADEGPFPERDYSVPWQVAPAEELQIKTGILNAYYFPDGDYQMLSPETSPVNSFRIVFNKYLGANFPELADRTYVFPDDSQLYTFHERTERVRDYAVPVRLSPRDQEVPG